MTTVFNASAQNFINTPNVERISKRALRYIESGYSIHLRGAAGVGKTTLALHLANMRDRPIVILFGDDELKTSDTVGNQSGYTRKKVVDNFIHNVVKIEDQLQQNWIDSRLTLACKEGFTLVYDEFNRSRPEVNNVLLSVLEEKMLILPPNQNRTEYVRVHPQFRVIFTSNPEEYHGVHATQDALLDRVITINMPEPDRSTQEEIVINKTGVDPQMAKVIVDLVCKFRDRSGEEKSGGLRSCLIIAKICQDHDIEVNPKNINFQDICIDVLLARTNRSFAEASKILKDILAKFPQIQFARKKEEPTTEKQKIADSLPLSQPKVAPKSNNKFTRAKVPTLVPDSQPKPTPKSNNKSIPTQVENSVTASQTQAVSKTEKQKMANSFALLQQKNDRSARAKTKTPPKQAKELLLANKVPYESEVYNYLRKFPGGRFSELAAELGIDRVQVVNALESLKQQGILLQMPNNSGENKSESATKK